jgi:hypothetical protein
MSDHDGIKRSIDVAWKMDSKFGAEEVADEAGIVGHRYRLS